MRKSGEQRTEAYFGYAGGAVGPMTTPRAESIGGVASSARQQANAKRGLEPAIIVIFGITGDLSQRYILPALYHLISDNLLHEKTKIVGVSRRDVPVKDILDRTKLCVLEADTTCDPAALNRMQAVLSMFKVDLTDGKDYDRLRERLDEIEDEQGLCMNRLYYLSVPPGVYQPIVTLLGEHGLNTSCQHGTAATRLLIEKPFGYDVPSARELIGEIDKQFREEQVFRIDHYLAKETVQNILAFRLHNPIFEALWSNQYVSSIDIEAKESIGIERRASFYEQTGALRDFIQSHLLQLLAIVAMEKPANLQSEGIHRARLKLLESVEQIPADKVSERTARGQYKGYREDVKNPDSCVETYAAIKLFIRNDRWQGVPITIRTGKALNEKRTTITLKFKHPEGATHHANVLTFYVQPHEGIGVDLYVKRPGFDNEMQAVPMDFLYERSFNSHDHPNAYERVLVDAIRGDRTLFATGPEVLASWRILQPILEAWTKDAKGLRIYKKGSAGPAISY
jgi:glucose-6-phosphate 1-dehydrogenase